MTWDVLHAISQALYLLAVVVASLGIIAYCVDRAAYANRRRRRRRRTIQAYSALRRHIAQVTEDKP